MRLAPCAVIARRVAFGAAGLIAALLIGCFAIAGPAAAEDDEPENKITGISFFGNRHTDEAFLRRELGIEVGDPYDMDELDAGIRRLEDTRLFSFVEIQEKSDGAGGTLLVVQVEERARARLGLWFQYDRRHSLQPGVKFRFVNPRGVGDEIWVGARFGKRDYYAGGWINPWVIGGKKIETELGASRDHYRFVFEPFTETDRRVSLAARHGKLNHLRGAVLYEYRWLTLDPGGDVTDPAIELMVEHDDRLRPVYAQGINARASARFSGLGQDVTYQIYNLHLAGFAVMPYSLTLGGRTTWRLSGGTVPIYERVYMGGPSDVRGVNFGTLRGDESFIGTIEVRRPIINLPSDEGGSFGVGVHGFADWGKAWDRTAGWDSEVMRSSVGLGAHLNLMKYNLRFEWAHDDEGVDSYVFDDEFTF